MTANLRRAMRSLVFVLMGFMALAGVTGLTGVEGWAQTTLGAINGTVQDPSGAVLSDATITVTNVATNVTRTVKSQNNGYYQILNLPVGIYRMTVEHDGFDKTIQERVRVQEAAATTVNPSLRVGKATEVVSVTANPMLNATDPTNGYTLDKSQIEATPLATGSFTQLAVLSPGVNAEFLSGIGANAGLGNQPIWANGQRDTSNTFQVDGVDVTNLFNGKSSSQDTSQRYNFNIGEGANVAGSIQDGASVYGSNGNGMPTPPPDFLQELRVNTSQYDSQQGATSGAQIDANTQTGTNDFHGSLWGTRATNAMNAAPFFFKQANLISPESFPASLVNPQLHKDYVGGTLGGPILRNRLFFFVGYQQMHTADQSTGLSQMIVPYGLTDDRSNAGLLNALNSYYTASGQSTVSSVTIDPIVDALFNAKLPNGQYMIPSVQNPDPNLVATFTPNVTLIGSTLFNSKQATVSLDYNINPNDQLSAKYYWQEDPYDSPYGVSNTGGFPEKEDSGSQVAALTNSMTIGQRMNWVQTLGFARIKVYSNFNQQVTGGNGPTFGIGFPNSFGLPGMTFSKFAVANSQSSLTAGPKSAFVDDGYFQNRLNPSSSLIYTIGRHTLIVGGGYSYTQLNIRNLRSGIGQLTTKDFPHLLAGDVSKSNYFDSISAQGQNLANRYYRSNEGDAYLQDKFQVSGNLSLTAGVRYDYHGAFTEKYGNIFNFDPSLYNVSGSTVTDGASATGTSTGFTVNNAGFVVAGNNKYFPTKGVSDSTQTGRQWGISPRVGFAWSPKRDDGKVVISGGAGIYYDRGELFSYLSQPAGGSIGGPFGVTEAPPLSNYYTGSGTFEQPLQGVTITPPNANPQFFDTQLQQILNSNLQNCGGVNNQATFGAGCESPFSFGAYARDNKLPYTTNFSLKFQWQASPDVAFSIGYTGNRGFHGVIPIPFNQPEIATQSNPINGEHYSYGYEVLNASAPPADAYGDLQPISTEPWDGYDGGNVDFRTPYIGYSPNAALFKAAGTSAYDGLETHLEKRLSHRFLAGISYTFSRSHDEQSDIGLFFTGSNPNNLRSSYALSDFDRTNVFTMNYLIELPNPVKSHGWMSYITNDWQLSGITTLQSGEPYSLYEFNGAVASIYYGNFPTLLNPVLGIKNPSNPRSALTGHSGAFRQGVNYIPAIDPSQIAINFLAPGQKGIPSCTNNEPCDFYETDYAPGDQRNIFRQAFQKRADVSLRKDFHIRHSVIAQYQFNVYNVTNTTSLDIPQDQTQIGQAFVGPTANYGQVTAPINTNVNSPTIQGIINQLYVSPALSATGTGRNTVVSGSNFGSVTGTIGSARIIDMGLHVNF